MTLPVRDREQAIQTVVKAVHPGSISRPAAGRIVDALLPQPDPEVERLRQRIAQLERLRRNAKEMEDLHWDKTTLEAELGQERHIRKQLDADLRAAIEREQQPAERAEKLLYLLVAHEDSRCSFDHHGYCQEHGWFGEPGECGIREARQLLGLDQRSSEPS